MESEKLRDWVIYLVIAVILVALVYVFSRGNSETAEKSSQRTKTIVKLERKSDSSVKVIADTCRVGKAARFCIVETNPAYKIINAYYDSFATDKDSVDIIKNEIARFRNKLWIENVTVKIYLTPEVAGNFTFDRIVLLLKSKNDKFYFQNYNFEYTVY